MLTKKIITAIFATSLISLPSMSYPEDECTAAKPRPVIKKEIQEKVKSYAVEWEHSSGHETGIIETMVLNSGATLKVESGGCESYGINYVITVDGQLISIPEKITEIGSKFEFLKDWIAKAGQVGKELQLLGIKLDGLKNVVSVKQPYKYLDIYNFPGEISIQLSDNMGYEMSSLAFKQQNNKKVEITIGHGFAL